MIITIIGFIYYSSEHPSLCLVVLNTLVELMHQIPFQMWKVLIISEYGSSFFSMTSFDVLFMFVCLGRSGLMEWIVDDVVDLFRMYDINGCLWLGLLVLLVEVVYLGKSFYLEIKWVIFIHSSPFINIYYLIFSIYIFYTHMVKVY